MRDFTFFLSDPSTQQAFWAQGIADQVTFSGPQRFVEAQAWALAHEDGRPCLCAGTFEAEGTSNLPGLTLIKPQSWAWGPINDCPLFTNIQPRSFAIISQVPIEPIGGYVAAAEEAIRSLNTGLCQKLVLARGYACKADRPQDPLAFASNWLPHTARAQLLVWAHPNQPSYIALTPEILIQQAQGLFKTEALAGTAPRGADATDDTILGQSLIESLKDGQEHQIVVDFIAKRLQNLGLKVQLGPRRLRLLPHLQHLHTPISATGTVPILELVAALHPTPAVCGQPEAVAAALIKQLEGFERGYYAGTFGWFGPSDVGHFAVALRGLTLHGDRAVLLAGAGIVASSDSQLEYQEVDLKLAGIQESLGLENIH